MTFRPFEHLLWLALKLAKRFDRRPADVRYFDPAKVSRILVVSSTALGDAVLSTAGIRALRQRYPQAIIVGLFHRKYIELFAQHPDMDAVIAYHGGYRRFWRTIRELRRHHFDVAAIFHGNEPQATPMAYLAGIPYIFKLPNTSVFRFLLANADPVLTWKDFQHGLSQRRKVAELAGATLGEARMTIPITPAGRAVAESFLKEQGVKAEEKLVGLQLGASSRSRMWPAERFVALARQLLDVLPAARIVLTGSPEERPYCQSVAQQIGHGAINAAGALPLSALPALVGRMNVLVTGDTGTLHLAIAVGTPTVSLFAVSDPAKSGPAYDLHKHLVVRTTCDAPGITTKSDDQTCISRISVAEVVQAVTNLLKEPTADSA
jgi:ADP-heptose:LPS heptosyltransferase